MFSGYTNKQSIQGFLYLLVFWLPYAPAVIESCVITCSVLWVIKRLILLDFSSQERSEKTSPGIFFASRFLKAFEPQASFLSGPIAVFLFLVVLSAIGSGFPEITIRGFITKILEWFAVYFLVIEVLTERKHIQVLLGIFIFTSAAVLLDGLIQFYWTGKDIFFGHVLAGQRVTASFKNANQLGGYLLYVIPLLLVLFLLGKKERKRHNVLTASVVC